MTRTTGYSNLFGAAASGLCAIHCAVTPLIFAAKPVLESTLGGHDHGNPFWAAFDYVFLVLSLVAVWYSARHTDHQTLKKVLWAAWGVFAIGLLGEAIHLPFSHWLMYAGSITLVVAHLKNYQHCNR
ncbi:MAG: MerC domain-containing protein [Bacteroidota bacterium]